MSTLTDVLNLLMETEEAEGESQRLWDDSFSNLAFGRLSEEKRAEYITQTYKATTRHARAMEQLREAMERLRSLR